MKTTPNNTPHHHIHWKRTAAILAAALLLAAGLSACKNGETQDPDSSSSAVVSQMNRSDVFPDGTSIGGKNIGGKTVAEATEIARAALEETVNNLEISVKFKDDTISLTSGDFAVQDILDLTIPDMLQSGQAKDFDLPFVTDLSESGRQKLEEAAKACRQEPKEASVEGYDSESESFQFTGEQTGTRVDMNETLKSVRQLLAQKHGGAIQAAFVETKPKLTKQYLEENFKRLSTYSTVSTNNYNGNSNMALALSHVNGTILKPGEVFSYNTSTGDSTDPNNGWLPAGGLVGGISVQTYGGGICQGSTTIYNAALMAGMEIVERECHSIPSSYCPIGLDATVDYGSIDFKFRNCLDAPIYISSWMDGVTLTCNIYGVFPEEWDNIELGSQQTGSEPPRDTVRFDEDSSLAPGQFVRKSSGNSGYYASAWRTYYKDGQEVKTESLKDSYYGSTGKVFTVGPGTDTSKIDTSLDSGNVNSSTPTPAPSTEPSPEPTAAPEEPTPPPYEPPVIEDPTPEPPPEDDPTDEPPPIFDPDVPDDGGEGGDYEG